MNKPEPLPIVNHHELSVLVKQYIDFVASPEYHEGNDFKSYIFEAALEAYYGKDIWKFINAPK